jgi:hypothetical protein
MGANWWYKAPVGSVASAQVIGVMGLVFLGWRVKGWERGMGRWFLHRSVNLGVRTRATEWRDCFTLFTSTVSAYGFETDLASRGRAEKWRRRRRKEGKSLRSVYNYEAQC